MPPHLSPRWHRTQDRLVLQLGVRRDPVPQPITEWLVGPGGVGLSGDAAHDLLRLEQRVRHVIAQLVEEVNQADQRIADQRATAGCPAQRRQRRRRRRRRSRAERTLQIVADGRAETLESIEGARSLLESVRTYVIELDAPHGLLRETAEGWRRSPDPPAGVVVFNEESAFLDADARRAMTGEWGGATLAGVEQFGLAWRRDGDEDDPADRREELSRAGPWQIGYIPRTTEIYAIRRCGYLSRQVWLLGTGFASLSSARDCLLPIMARMAEPNSLTLAAGTVQAAQMWRRSTTSTVFEPERLAQETLNSPDQPTRGTGR